MLQKYSAAVGPAAGICPVCPLQRNYWAGALLPSAAANETAGGSGIEVLFWTSSANATEPDAIATVTPNTASSELAILFQGFFAILQK